MEPLPRGGSGGEAPARSWGSLRGASGRLGVSRRLRMGSEEGVLAGGPHLFGEAGAAVAGGVRLGRR